MAIWKKKSEDAPVEPTPVAEDSPIEPAPEHHRQRMDLVGGGRVKHISFHDLNGGSLESASEPAPEPVAEPVAAPLARTVETTTVRIEPVAKLPANDDFRSEVDNLGGRSWSSPRGTRTTTIRSRTVYETPRGSVVSWDDGQQKTLSIVRRDGGNVEDVRFLHAQVDRAISHVALEQEETVRETVTEYVREEPKARDYRFVEPVARSESTVSTEPARTVLRETVTTRTTTEATPWEPSWTEGRPVPVPDLARKAPPAPPRKSRGPGPYYGYDGDNHPVIDLEGIGPEYARRLGALGVETTARLCYEDGERLAELMGLAPRQVEEWQSMAELIKVSGIGKQYAEVLARSGVRGIDELKARKSADIAAAIEELVSKSKVTIVGNRITEARIAGWQKAARRMKKKRLTIPEN